MTDQPRVIQIETIRAQARELEHRVKGRGMTDEQADKLEPGIYRVYYVFGAVDVAAIGRRPPIRQGERQRPGATWIAPVRGSGSCTADGVVSNVWYWDMVERVERIEI